MSTDIKAFAQSWIADWNGRHLGAILTHYADEVVFRSPKILIFTDGATDTLRGRSSLRPYFARGLANRPALLFELVSVCVDRTGVALTYTAEDGRTAIETMSLDAEGKVVEARVFYDPPIE